MKVAYEPKEHPRINAAEFKHMQDGGALVDMDETRRTGRDAAGKATQGPAWSYLRDLLTNRMLVGVYIGQYCITALTYFVITWFPIYLIKGRGMSILQVGFVAALPAICGFTGGILGGALSDVLLKRGHSVTVARKTPFVIGMLLSTMLVVCNFLDAHWAVIAVMALAFFGKGLAAIGWAVIADASPKEAIGLTGGVFNGLGNIAGIVTPIVIGYILHVTGSFNGALYFVGAHSLLAMFSYLFIVGEIRRVTLRTPAAEASQPLSVRTA
jgi:sugar phosphate permease